MNELLVFLFTWQCWVGVLISSVIIGILAIITGFEPKGWRTGMMGGIAFLIGALVVIFSQ